jgi:predicted porin
MKKTLVALAVLAASGASFAQVTMTGEFTWGFKSTTTDTGTTTSAANQASGFGVDYSNINFAASEDLGGGTKLAVSMGIDGADRTADSGGYAGTGTAVGGVDAKLTLTNGASKLLLGSMRNADYLSEGIASTNGVWIDLDGYIFSAHTNSQRIEYSYALGPVSVGYQFLQSSTSPGEGAGISGDAVVVGQPRNLVQATYAAGPLTANLGLGVYSNEVDNSIKTNKNLTRVSAAYDLGVAKIGGGYSVTKKTRGSLADTYLSVGVPVGALQLGADWGTRKTDHDGVDTADGTVGAWGLGAVYSLSKRTVLVANYRSYEAVIGANTRSTDTRLYIDHSF